MLKLSELSEVLRDAATTASMVIAGLEAANDRIECLEKELASRPTTWAYEQACKALRHWREEARRLGNLAGEEPRQLTISQ